MPETQNAHQAQPSPARSGRLGLRSEEHTSELQSLTNLVCRLLLEKKKKRTKQAPRETRPHRRLRPVTQTSETGSRRRCSQRRTSRATWSPRGGRLLSQYANGHDSR